MTGRLASRRVMAVFWKKRILMMPCLSFLKLALQINLAITFPPWKRTGVIQCMDGAFISHRETAAWLAEPKSKFIQIIATPVKHGFGSNIRLIQVVLGC